MSEEQAAAPSAAVVRWLAVAAVLGALVGGVVVLGTGPAVPVEAPEAPWRRDYDRGWARLVEDQAAGHRPDEASRAACRWWADGPGRREIRIRSAFVAGCDTAALMTNLEAP